VCGYSRACVCSWYTNRHIVRTAFYAAERCSVCGLPIQRARYTVGSQVPASDAGVPLPAPGPTCVVWRTHAAPVSLAHELVTSSLDHGRALRSPGTSPSTCKHRPCVSSVLRACRTDQPCHSI